MLDPCCRRLSRGWQLALALPVVLACGGSPGPRDSGSDSGPTCRDDSACDDGVFCTGRERCAPEAPGADPRGCVGGEPPCVLGLVCVEASETCDSCATTTDGDGDGVDAIACGGADCDDADPDRFPGNLERCDASGHDEDCDPATVGERDEDGDGAIDSACCNGSICGTDCDDLRSSVAPDAAEVCNGRDDDCDGTVDEDGEPITWCRDGDGDRYGAAATGSRVSCATPGAGWESACSDCDDSAAAVHPAAAEVAGNGRDDDCDGEVDEASRRVLGGTIGPLGGAVESGGTWILDGRLETFAWTCDASGNVCIAGGVLP